MKQLMQASKWNSNQMRSFMSSHYSWIVECFFLLGNSFDVCFHLFISPNCVKHKTNTQSTHKNSEFSFLNFRIEIKFTLHIEISENIAIAPLQQQWITKKRRKMSQTFILVPSFFFFFLVIWNFYLEPSINFVCIMSARLIYVCFDFMSFILGLAWFFSFELNA